MKYIFNAVTPPVYTTSDNDSSSNMAVLVLIVVAIIVIVILILAAIGRSSNRSSASSSSATNASSAGSSATNGSATDVSPKKGHPFLTFLSVSIIVAAIVFGGLKLYDVSNQKSNGGTGNEGNPLKLTRSATNADITLEEGDIDWLSAGCVYILTPKYDVKNLSLQITIYNDKKTIGQKRVQVGNVDQNNTYNVTVALSELSIGLKDVFEAFSTTYYWRYEVTGGTVSYFA